MSPPRTGLDWPPIHVQALLDRAEQLGTLAFEFRIAPPPEPRRAGTQRSREVLVGRFLSTARLEGIRTITVIGAENRRSARR